MRNFLLRTWASLIEYVTKAALLLSFALMVFAEVRIGFLLLTGGEPVETISVCVALYAMLRLNNLLNGGGW